MSSASGGNDLAPSLAEIVSTSREKFQAWRTVNELDRPLRDLTVDEDDRLGEGLFEVVRDELKSLPSRQLILIYLKLGGGDEGADRAILSALIAEVCGQIEDDDEPPDAT